jgi:hypothetical protein
MYSLLTSFCSRKNTKTEIKNRFKLYLFFLFPETKAPVVVNPVVEEKLDLTQEQLASKESK